MRKRLKSRTIGAGLVAVALTLGSSLALAVDEPENVIKYRQGVMKANSGHMGSLAAVAKGEVSFMDEAAVHAQSIHGMSQQIGRLFPEGTGPGDTEIETDALPSIWEQNQEFEQALTRLQEESAKMVEAANGGDQTAFAQQVAALGRACGGCHEDFRKDDD